MKTQDLDLDDLMRRQLKLSVGCAAAFLSVLLLLPLANYFYPAVMSRQIGGFTLSWLILGLLFFPLVWAISWFFIRRSIALEAADSRPAPAGRGAAGVLPS